jgi:hypothetical protein
LSPIYCGDVGNGIDGGESQATAQTSSCRAEVPGAEVDLPAALLLPLVAVSFQGKPSSLPAGVTQVSAMCLRPGLEILVGK